MLATVRACATRHTGPFSAHALPPARSADRFAELGRFLQVLGSEIRATDCNVAMATVPKKEWHFCERSPKARTGQRSGLAQLK
eukprot:SAG31_NODE_29323_length_397_cov_0.677852_1_plen_82_part_10